MGCSRSIRVQKYGEDLIKKRNGHYWYYFGQTKGYKGVGWYVNSRIWHRVTEIKKCNERICILKLKINNTIQLALIQVYAPILDAKTEVIEQFYEELQEVVDREKEFYTVVMGDWNGQIGKQDSKCIVVGEHTVWG